MVTRVSNFGRCFTCEHKDLIIVHRWFTKHKVEHKYFKYKDGAKCDFYKDNVLLYSLYDEGTGNMVLDNYLDNTSISVPDADTAVETITSLINMSR